MEFEDLKFELTNEHLIVYLLDIYKTEIPLEELDPVGIIKVTKNSIEAKKENKFGMILSKYLLKLTNTINNKETVYIHQNSGIPLMGSTYFGIVDRGSNVIELRPLTSCNLNCMFCSVDEGIDSKKNVDYIVEKDYLVSEFNHLLKQKNCNEIEALINPQGEPMLYTRIVSLVSDLAKNPKVKSIAMNTNGTLLTKKKVDELISAGMTRINFSLNSMSQELATKIAGTAYKSKNVQEIIEYTSKKIDINIAPVLANDINNEEIEGILEFVQKLQKKTDKIIFLGIQNLLNYKFGRNPVKQMEWDKFNEMLDSLEKKYSINLRDSPSFKFVETKELPKPFKKSQTVEVMILCKGRTKNERIAAAKNRAINVINCFEKNNKKTKVKIIRIKHNIFMATK